MLADRRYCYPLTISDFASRYLFTCDALSTTQEVGPTDTYLGGAGHIIAIAGASKRRGYRGLVGEA
jgi:hypothetical protein